MVYNSSFSRLKFSYTDLIIHFKQTNSNKQLEKLGEYTFGQTRKYRFIFFNL